jgi:GTP-binding protein YchF
MLQVGIIGLPNVGKSTLFQTLTKKQVDCANFPFCTIEPNIGVVEVPDNRLQQLSIVSKSQKVIPTAIEFVDIAGLVKGAHKGEGLGNKFLSNIREVDMIVHVVRVFEDDNVAHVDGSVNPARDVETIEIELAMADLVIVEKRFETTRGKMKSGKTKELEIEESALSKIFEALSDWKLANTVEFSDDETQFVRTLNLLTFKPILYVLNVSDSDVSSSQSLVLSPSIPISIKLESEIMEMSLEDQHTFLKELGLEQSGLDRLITKCYEMLNLITFFTSGEKESRAWTVTKGSTAPQAAGKIHTDFEKAFIRAEVIDWKDFVELGESGAKEAGKLRIEGKDYVVQNGDVCHFRVGV